MAFVAIAVEGMVAADPREDVSMNINRLIRHLWSHGRQVEKFFSKQDLAAITKAIGNSELLVL